jgi:hypothetical protein
MAWTEFLNNIYMSCGFKGLTVGVVNDYSKGVKMGGTYGRDEKYVGLSDFEYGASNCVGELGIII